MKIEHISERIKRVVLEPGDYNINNYSKELIALEQDNILTFGDSNFRLLERYFKAKGYPLQSLDLCLYDDKSIGLEMPNTWYLNKGKHALSIAMYYNYLTFHGILEQHGFDSFNQEIAEEFGHVACLEVYDQNDLQRHLQLEDIPYFGTPKTLTECIRYLEGWEIEKYPRLKGYATFSKFIELWSKMHFPFYNELEWRLGKDQSNKLNGDRNLSNVRKAIRFFWENYLLPKREISPEDVEIDILSPRFQSVRAPKFILMSEDLFSKENSNFEIFKNLTKRKGIERKYISKRKNNFPMKNALIAEKEYPYSTIVLIEFNAEFGRNFSLINPIKQSINEEVVLTTKVLKSLVDQKKNEDFFLREIPA